jgi:hypothetical protein
VITQRSADNAATDWLTEKRKKGFDHRRRPNERKNSEELCVSKRKERKEEINIKTRHGRPLFFYFLTKIP